MRKKDNTDYYINRHSCFLLQYHIVFVTKYRHPVLTGKVKDVVYERIHYVAEHKNTVKANIPEAVVVFHFRFQKMHLSS